MRRFLSPSPRVALEMAPRYAKERLAHAFFNSLNRRVFTMDQKNDNNQVVELSADIVSAYVSNNPVPAAELPALIADIHRSLTGLVSGIEVSVAEPLKPAVSIKKSVTPEFIISLEDGKKFKSLKRHLATRYGMTPEDYRAKWNLPADYPMVAPAYAAKRSEMAIKLGLGRNPKVTPVPTPVKRGRAKSA